MASVKSFSVGNGDMFYINHNSDNFTVIDSCLNLVNGVKEKILNEIKEQSKNKGINRFISTHPDNDHISGLVDFVNQIGISNFYVVKNEATKKDQSDDFDKYCELRDDSKKAFELEKGCSRKWMNKKDETRGSSGINCLWPITSNEKYQEALLQAKKGECPNNISPVITYEIEDSFSFQWMGDMETDMQTEFDNKVACCHKTIVFAPHHGRQSGHIPSSLLDKLTPKIIVVGEAPSDCLDYYRGYVTITQNSAGDILFKENGEYLDVFVSNTEYSTNKLQYNMSHLHESGMKYAGSVSK